MRESDPEWSIYIHERGAQALSRLTAAASTDLSRTVLRQVVFGSESAYATDSYIGRNKPARLVVDERVVGLVMPVKADSKTYDEVFGEVQ